MEEKGAGWLKAAAVFQGILAVGWFAVALRTLYLSIETHDSRMTVGALTLLGIAVALGFATHGLMKRRLGAWRASVVVGAIFFLSGALGVGRMPMAAPTAFFFGGHLVALIMGRRAIPRPEEL